MKILTAEIVGPLGIHVGRVEEQGLCCIESAESCWEELEGDTVVPSAAEAEAAREGGLDMATQAAVYLEAAAKKCTLISGEVSHLQ